MRLLEARVQSLLGKPLTRKDRAVINRQGMLGIQKIEAEIDALAKKLLKERISKRYDKEKRVQIRPKPRPVRKL